jgi:hypothetical protein
MVLMPNARARFAMNTVNKEISAFSSITVTQSTVSVADPDHFDADPDPTSEKTG